MSWFQKEFVRNMTEDLFVDGYVAASLLTNNMEVTTSSMTAEADYISRMAATGLAVTGSFDVERWNILPTFAVDYSVVSSQEAAFEYWLWSVFKTDFFV